MRSNRINFGKYEGKEWSDLDTSYLLWIVNNYDLDDNNYNMAYSELVLRNKRFIIDYSSMGEKELIYMLNEVIQALNVKLKEDGKVSMQIIQTET